MYIHFSPDERKAIIQALLLQGNVTLANRIRKQGRRSRKEERYLDTARSRQREGSLEIDDNALVSCSNDGGAYVMAWMWVSDEDVRCQRR
jgi:hypothetical protein